MFNHLRKRLLRPAAPAPLPPPADDSVLEAEEPPRGCGWFDSSHELQAGLQVMEHASVDAASLPLGDWLALHLGSWQPATGQGCAA